MSEVQTPKTIIRPNTAVMVKTKGGSFHTDDFIGNALAGLTVAQVLEIGSNAGVDVTKYAHLNPGQQRMTVGNALRRLAKDEEISNAIVTAADELKAQNQVAAEAKAAEKEAAKAAKAAEKEAAKAAKAAAKAAAAE